MGPNRSLTPDAPRATRRARRPGALACAAGLGLSLLVECPAQAQVRVEVSAPRITVAAPSVTVAAPPPTAVVVGPPPAIVFEAPPALVTVTPGVQVVPDYDDEVFVVGNVYWTRRGHRWYRSADHRGGWVLVERGVPGPLVKLRPGRYRRWKGPKHAVVVGAPGAVMAPGVVVVPPGRGHGRGKKRGHW